MKNKKKRKLKIKKSKNNIFDPAKPTCRCRNCWAEINVCQTWCQHCGANDEDE